MKRDETNALCADRRMNSHLDIVSSPKFETDEIDVVCASFDKLFLSIHNSTISEYVNACVEIKNILRGANVNVFEYVLAHNYCNVVIEQVCQNDNVAIIVPSLDVLWSLFSTDFIGFEDVVLNSPLINDINQRLLNIDDKHLIRSLLRFIGSFVSNLKICKIKCNQVFPSITDDYFCSVYEKFGKRCALPLVFACTSFIKNMGYGQLFTNLIIFLIKIYSENKYNITTELFTPILTNFVDNYSEIAFPIINTNNFLFQNMISSNLNIENKEEIEVLETMRFILKCYQKYPKLKEQICASLPIDFLADAISKFKYQNSLISAIKLTLLKTKNSNPNSWIISYLTDLHIITKLQRFVENGSFNLKTASLDLLSQLIKGSTEDNPSLFSEGFLESLVNLLDNEEYSIIKKVMKLLSIILEKATVKSVPSIVHVLNSSFVSDILENFCRSANNERLALLSRHLLQQIRSVMDAYDAHHSRAVFLSV